MHFIPICKYFPWLKRGGDGVEVGAKGEALKGNASDTSGFD